MDERGINTEKIIKKYLNAMNYRSVVIVQQLNQQNWIFILEMTAFEYLLKGLTLQIKLLLNIAVELDRVCQKESTSRRIAGRKCGAFIERTKIKFLVILAEWSCFAFNASPLIWSLNKSCPCRTEKITIRSQLSFLQVWSFRDLY